MATCHPWLGSARLGSDFFLGKNFYLFGLGDETLWPPFIFVGESDSKLVHAVQEAKEGLFPVVSSMLAKADVKPADIVVLIVACSMYSPVLSLATLIVNHFSMAPHVKSYNLSGMGCNVGTVGIDMATRALGAQARPDGYALVVIIENTHLNWYFGDNRHMLMTNYIFYVGTAAALLTDEPSHRRDAKIELVRTLRTHHGVDDASYNAAVQMEDEDGNVGVALTKDLVRVVGADLRCHISNLASFVLPISELLRRHIFYELAYFDAQRCICRGDRLWMLAFSTGFKACSVVWKALKDSAMDSDNPWRVVEIERTAMVTMVKRERGGASGGSGVDGSGRSKADGRDGNVDGASGRNGCVGKAGDREKKERKK